MTQISDGSFPPLDGVNLSSEACLNWTRADASNITARPSGCYRNNASFAINATTASDASGSGQWSAEVIQRIVTLSIIVVMTILGNSFILVILTCSKTRRMNSRVNIFIINLAIGDLCVCVVTMTTEILFAAFDHWVLGAAACKIILYGQIVTLASTTFLLTTMSFDRYLALCKPLSLRCSSARVRQWMIALSWVAALIFALPQLFIFVQIQKTNNGVVTYQCASKGYTAFWQRKVYFTFLASYILVIPSIIISFCYINIVRVVWQQGRDFGLPKSCTSSTSTSTRSTAYTMRKCVSDQKAIPRVRLRTIKMTLCIIILFIACWTPYFITHLVRIYSEYTIKPPRAVMAFAETVALLQSALNPILYGCFNIKLKRGLSEVFCQNRNRRFYNGRSGFYSEYYSCSDENASSAPHQSRKQSLLRGHPRDLNGYNTNSELNASPNRRQIPVANRKRPSWRERIFKGRGESAATAGTYSVTLNVPLRGDNATSEVVTSI
ncbi:gonadotropin-releasing hormone receptor-like [Tubulanus polymorphus]|uniref:gonadotropin-releasing hormone receptor-like n=1 Tax=Tubulanus polymorphus TaxID=672921 RepID=UPI003DA34CEF